MHLINFVTLLFGILKHVRSSALLSTRVRKNPEICPNMFPYVPAEMKIQSSNLAETQWRFLHAQVRIENGSNRPMAATTLNHELGTPLSSVFFARFLRIKCNRHKHCTHDINTILILQQHKQPTTNIRCYGVSKFFLFFFFFFSVKIRTQPNIIFWFDHMTWVNIIGIFWLGKTRASNLAIFQNFLKNSYERTDFI